MQNGARHQLVKNCTFEHNSCQLFRILVKRGLTPFQLLLPKGSDPLLTFLGLSLVDGVSRIRRIVQYRGT